MDRVDGRVAIIGAGVGGLTAALRLQAAGRPVTVLERAPAPGGKMRQIQVGSKRLDAGPTVFTMRWVFDRLFADLGERLDDHVTLKQASVLARHAWQDGSRLDLFADIEASEKAVADFAGRAEARGFRAFCDETAAIFDLLKDPFLCSPAPDIGAMVRAFGLKSLGAMRKMKPFSTMQNGLERHFRDPRLRQLFGRYATYCGSSPYQAPATLMLVSHVEQAGVWYVDGGMHALAQGLARLIEARGGTIRYECEVAEITVRQGRASGVRLSDGEAIAADAVVMNGDNAALFQGMLGPDVRRAAAAFPPRDRSLSALTWLIDAETDGFPLVHHNVFFSRDYQAEFDALFKRRTLPAEPTVYICAQDREDAAQPPPDGRDGMLLIVNAPALQTTGMAANDPGAHEFLEEELDRCETASFDLLRRCGLTIRRQPDRVVRTGPAEWSRLFPGTGGAIYGRASHGWRASLQRQGCRSAVPGLYLAGGSVHPGPGVPMAALSGLMAAESLATDLGSTRRSARTAMSGGISTR